MAKTAREPSSINLNASSSPWSALARLPCCFCHKSTTQTTPPAVTPPALSPQVNLAAFGPLDHSPSLRSARSLLQPWGSKCQPWVSASLSLVSPQVNLAAFGPLHHSTSLGSARSLPQPSVHLITPPALGGASLKPSVRLITPPALGRH